MQETALPRPVVIEGDLGDADLGLDRRSVEWIERNCDSVVHNAASLVFRGDDLDGRAVPFQRRRHAADARSSAAARASAISPRLHGLRLRPAHRTHPGKRRGCRPDARQRLREDEAASRAAGPRGRPGRSWLDRPTIYRPSIIVGDSQTGYTTTYHGFYAPLKLAHTMASKITRGTIGGKQLVDGAGHRQERPQEFSARRLGLGGDEPYPRPSGSHGATYHLTSPRPPLVLEMGRFDAGSRRGSFRRSAMGLELGTWTANGLPRRSASSWPFTAPIGGTIPAST